MDKNELMSNFHRNLRSIAFQKNVKLYEIEKAIGATKGYFSFSLSRKTSIPFYVVYKVAELLRVPISDLTRNTEDEEKEKLRQQYMETRNRLEDMGDIDFLRMV